MALYVHWSAIIWESSQIYEGLYPYTSYLMFSENQVPSIGEEYTDFQHLGRALELSADYSIADHAVNS